MTTQREGMEAHGVPVDIQTILDGHQEVLVIVADPDGASEGESTVAVFSKLLDRKSVITPMLANLLRNLLATTNGKQCSGITGKASASA
jgi:hypothetical protein